MSAIEVVKKQPLRQVQTVQHLLWNDQAREQLASVAAQHMNPTRMMRVVANAIRTTPKLQQCDPMSFLGALMQCAAFGLEPNTVMGHAYMIPFENKRKGITEVQLVIGYKGLIDLARRSGRITSIHAGIHYSDDETTGGLWDYEDGTQERLRHRNGDMNGEKKHAYAIAKFKDGSHAHSVLAWSQVMKIRDDSQGYKTALRYGKSDTPWITHEDAMAKKTAIRDLAKYLPLSAEFVDAITIDSKGADFRAFAVDPTMGMAPLQEYDEPLKVTDNVDQQSGQKITISQPKATSSQRPEDNKLAQMILKDALDMGKDASLDFHADELAKMQSENPETHTYIMEKLKRNDGANQ